MHSETTILILLMIVLLGLGLFDAYRTIKLQRFKKNMEKDFPKDISKLWACYSWRNLDIDQRISFPEDMPEKQPVVYHRLLRKAEEDTELIAYRVGDKYGVYTIFDCHPMPGSDRAPWDDGVKYDLILVGIVDLETAKEITETSMDKSDKYQRGRLLEKKQQAIEEEKAMAKMKQDMAVQ